MLMALLLPKRCDFPVGCEPHSFSSNQRMLVSFPVETKLPGRKVKLLAATSPAVKFNEQFLPGIRASG
jgi:hypothetical protein